MIQSGDVDEFSIDLPGGRFHCLREGPADGALVLCLHGFPDHPPSLAPLMTRLAAAGYRVVAPWMRGYRPSVERGPFHPDRLAVDVLELKHALSPAAPAHVVGHDWGAAATYGALLQTPSAFASAVSMAVPHPIPFLQALGRRPAQLLRSWYMLFFQLPALPERVLLGRELAFVDWLWRRWSPGYTLPDDRRRALHACLRTSLPAPLGYYRAIARPLGTSTRRIRRLGEQRVAVPTLHLHGADDGCIGADILGPERRFFERDYRCVVVPDVGHFLQIEAPDVMAGHILDWFAAHPVSR